MDGLSSAARQRSLKQTSDTLARISSVTGDIQQQCIQAAMVAIEEGAEEILAAILSCKAFQRKHKQKLLHEIPNLLYHAASILSLHIEKLKSIMKIIGNHVNASGQVELSEILRYLSDEGFSCLHYAAIEGNVEAARRLLKFGADGKQRSLDGNTALSFAISTNKKEFWKFILPVSDVNSRDEDHDTPLMFAAWRRKDVLVSDLILMGADVNACSRHGSTALWNAVYRGSCKCVVALLQNNADMNITCEGTHLFLNQEDENGYGEVRRIYPGHSRSLLWVAVDRAGIDRNRNLNIDMVTTLVEAGYDVTKEHWIGKFFHRHSSKFLSFRQRRRPSEIASDGYRGQELPENFVHDVSLQTLLIFLYTRPLRLKDLCRNRLRRHHRETGEDLLYPVWVTALCLGPALKDFLSLGFLSLTTK